MQHHILFSVLVALVGLAQAGVAHAKHQHHALHREWRPVHNGRHLTRGGTYGCEDQCMEGSPVCDVTADPIQTYASACLASCAGVPASATLPAACSDLDCFDQCSQAPPSVTCDLDTLETTTTACVPLCKGATNLGPGPCILPQDCLDACPDEGDPVCDISNTPNVNIFNACEAACANKDPSVLLPGPCDSFSCVEKCALETPLQVCDPETDTTYGSICEAQCNFANVIVGGPCTTGPPPPPKTCEDQCPDDLAPVCQVVGAPFSTTDHKNQCFADCNDVEFDSTVPGKCATLSCEELCMGQPPKVVCDAKTKTTYTTVCDVTCRDGVLLPDVCENQSCAAFCLEDGPPVCDPTTTPPSTYKNACAADCAGVPEDVRLPGECPSPP